MGIREVHFNIISILSNINIIDKNYCTIIRNEIDVFRKLFKEWFDTFTKDAFEDEWGLFV